MTNLLRRVAKALRDEAAKAPGLDRIRMNALADTLYAEARVQAQRATAVPRLTGWTP